MLDPALNTIVILIADVALALSLIVADIKGFAEELHARLEAAIESPMQIYIA